MSTMVNFGIGLTRIIMSIFSSSPQDLRNELKVPGSSPAHLVSFFSFFFPVFVCLVFFCLFVLLFFYKYLSAINSKKRNVFPEKRWYIKYVDKQSKFLSFPAIYCGKTRVDNHLIIF